MGFGLEIDMIRQAHERDLLTAPYVCDPEQAAEMARAGADVLVPHVGLTTKAGTARGGGNTPTARSLVPQCAAYDGPGPGIDQGGTRVVRPGGGALCMDRRCPAGC